MARVTEDRIAELEKQLAELKATYAGDEAANASVARFETRVTTLKQEMRENEKARLKRLFENTAKLLKVPETGGTILHGKNHSQGMIQAALHVGVDLEARDSLGRTPFLTAVANSVYPFVVGENPCAVDNEGNNAFHLIKSPFMIKALVELPIDADARNLKGRTPLDHHAERDDAAMVASLLKIGKVVPAYNTLLGKDALNLIARTCYDQRIQLNFDYAQRNLFEFARGPAATLWLEVAVRSGADATAVDSEGNTLLFYNTSRKWCDVHTKNKDGLTALMYHFDNGASDKASQLLKMGGVLEIGDNEEAFLETLKLHDDDFIQLVFIWLDQRIHNTN